MASSTPEAKARINIDRLLEQAGWAVQDLAVLNVQASRGVAAREFPLRSGHGFADYLLYVDGKAAGVVEAKPEGHTLTGVEAQSGKYGAGLPDNLPYYIRPLPFLYESTGVETRFTNGLDPQPRSRGVFSFHTPEILAEWLGESKPSWDIGQAPGSRHASCLYGPKKPAEQPHGDAASGRLKPLGGAGERHPQPGTFAG